MNEYNMIILGITVVGVLLLPTHLSHRDRQFTDRSALLTITSGPQGWVLHLRGVQWLQRTLLAALDWLGDQSVPLVQRALRQALPLALGAAGAALWAWLTRG